MTPYFWPIVGGVTTFVDGLVQELTVRGLEVRIWTRYGATDTNVEQGPENPYRFLRWARARMRKWHPDVIHAHAHWYVLASAYGIGRSVAPRTVFSVHTDLRPDMGILRRRLLSHLMGRADYVTVVSPSGARDLRVRFPGVKRIEQIPPGVTVPAERDVLAFRPGEFSEFRAGFPRLCSVGMMVWRDKVRGMEVLIRSMPLILRVLPDAKLVFVGDGTLRGDLERLVTELRLNRSVFFAGKQSSPVRFILASDLVVHYSFKDAFPQAVLESLALGRPVLVNEEVALNITADPVGMGILSVPATPEGFADSVSGLAASEALRLEMASRGAAAVRQAFSWAKTVDRFLALYGVD